MADHQRQPRLLQRVLRCCNNNESTETEQELAELDAAREVKLQSFSPSNASVLRSGSSQQRSNSDSQHHNPEIHVDNNTCHRCGAPQPSPPTALPMTSRRYQKSNAIHVARQANIKNEIDNRHKLLQAMRGGHDAQESPERPPPQRSQHQQQLSTRPTPPPPAMLPELTFDSFLDLVRQDFERKMKDRIRRVRRSILGVGSLTAK